MKLSYCWLSCEEKFVAYTHKGGEGFEISEETLIESFGAEFVCDLKTNMGRYLSIPFGDFHHSMLCHYPDLCIEGAPNVCFTQHHNDDMCIYKSACSDLAYLGQHEIAQAIMKEGQGLANGSSRAMDFLFISFKAKLPKWIQIMNIRIGNKFDWAADIPPGAVFVGVIVSSDGNASHAIAIHGNWIFYSNEMQAIPLCKEGLDYCTCDGDILSMFIKFHRGLLLHYNGTTTERKAWMTPPA